MGGLIDADALNIEQLFDTKNKSIPVSQYVNYLKGIEAVEKIIKNAPTVEERRHGHWDYSNIAKQGFKCSVCNRSSKNGSPFCQWCGAIMDEVSER